MLDHYHKSTPPKVDLAKPLTSLLIIVLKQHTIDIKFPLDCSKYSLPNLSIQSESSIVGPSIIFIESPQEHIVLPYKDVTPCVVRFLPEELVLTRQ